MIKMGEITCRIPSNGIKSEILYCTEPEGYRLDIWGIGIDLAMACFTILLFVVAAGALATAKGTLRQMQRDSDRQWESLRTQLDEQAELAQAATKADRRLAKEQLQMQALFSFIHSIRDLKIGHEQSAGEFSVSKTQMSVAWAIWAGFLYDDNHEFLKITQEFTFELGKVAEEVHRINREFQNDAVHPHIYVATMNAYSEYVGNYIGNLNAWQGSDTKRKDSEAGIAGSLRTMKEEFPLISVGIL